MVDDEKRHERQSPENIKELLGVVSAEVPSLIKNILASVFSEEAGRSMGKAAAAYYKELKQGGLPEQVAVKLTEEYMRTFTNLGDMLRSGGRSGRAAEEIGEEVKRRIIEKTEKGRREEEEEEQE